MSREDPTHELTRLQEASDRVAANLVELETTARVASCVEEHADEPVGPTVPVPSARAPL